MKELKKSVRNITEVIVHCTATPAGRDVTVADVDRWHRQRGFAGIGYHYLVALDGTVHAGRDVDIAGAHCRGHNRDTRTPEQRGALRGLLAALKRLYPGAVVRGHRDFAAKACPCFDATNEYAGL